MKFVRLLSLVFVACVSFSAQSASMYRVTSGNLVLSLELLGDDIIHVEWAEQGKASVGEIYTSPMISPRAPKPNTLATNSNVLKTESLSIKVDQQSLCLEVTDTRQAPGYRLSKLCPNSLKENKLAFSYSREGYYHIYGLGQQHPQPGTIDGEWRGKQRSPGSEMGNKMVYQGGGAVGNTQIPVAYMLGQGKQNYALFVDSPYAQTWDLAKDPYQVSLSGDAIRLFVIAGTDLPNLRSQYLALTGRAPVPPKKMFGLWLSEYGYDNWQEVDDKLASMKRQNIPVDGVVLDLQWFGGVKTDSESTSMGSLRWDKKAFPQAKTKLKNYREKQGIGVMAIEQPYIGKRLPEYLTLNTKGFLVRQCPYPCDPVYLDKDSWWGKGGMLDFTYTQAAEFWHDWRREQLIDDGIMGHWTDLGEPEIYDENAWYYGVDVGNKTEHTHAAVHNLYNLLWNKSIAEGYARNKHTQRPFVLSRSGTAGSQRYGVAMWSGDIGSNLNNLAGHLNAQMHMSLSGIDYFGSDVGGFHRKALGGDNLAEMYTQWMAVSAALDIPMRPHTENLCNCKESAPDRIGHIASNRANIVQRYELTPYYYTMAHKAYREGTAVISPLVYHFQEDPGVRALGAQKMIGDDLLVAAVAKAGAKEAMVYLPKGEWVDFHTNERYNSIGEWQGPFPLYQDNGVFQLPMFVRTGAIIPMQLVDKDVLNIEGLRSDGTQETTFVVNAYATEGKRKFTVYEDDGTSIGYQTGEVMETDVDLKVKGSKAEVVIHNPRGRYDLMPLTRNNLVRYIGNGANMSRVILNGRPLKKVNSAAELDKLEAGWYQDGYLVVAKTGVHRLNVGKRLEFIARDR